MKGKRKSESFMSRRSRSVTSIHTPKESIRTPTKSQKTVKNSTMSQKRSEKSVKVDNLNKSINSDRCIRISCGEKEIKSRSVSAYSS